MCARCGILCVAFGNPSFTYRSDKQNRGIGMVTNYLVWVFSLYKAGGGLINTHTPVFVRNQYIMALISEALDVGEFKI